MARILIVDDSATMRQMVNFTLSAAEHEVDEAANTDEALACVETRHFDAVIADLNMPGRNGIELIRSLRALPRFRTTPILMLTTESRAEVKQAGKAAGATGWIVKPFGPDALLGALQQLLR
ncbi:MAG TPA: response regulator [Burkholderiales bacterium]|nr:response regulator [Burkholderiales bacterium]